MKTSTMTVTAVSLLSACVATGPRTDEIRGNESAQVITREASLPYAVIAMDRDLAVQATHFKREIERDFFIRDSSITSIVLGVGDQVQITIVSTNDTGYLDIANSTLAPISSTSLPPQRVGPDGMISVPPIGRVRAEGISEQAFELLLTRRLGEVLVEPTAIVQLVDRQSAQVTMAGSIGSPGSYSINQNRRRLVEMIGAAGGAVGDVENMRVIITRGSQTGTAILKEVYENPALNVNLRAGDVIQFEPFEGQFTVLGAGGVNANLQFSDIATNLAESLGQSGGILTNRADPRGVFIYRLVPKDAAIRLGVDTSKTTGELVPVVFQFDMKQPESLFIAREFEVADGDILYVSTTLINDVNAALSAFRALILPAQESVMIVYP